MVGDTGVRPTPVATSNRATQAVDCVSGGEVSMSDEPIELFTVEGVV
jgi:hypothetical protein